MISFIKGSKYREIIRNQNEFQSIQPNGQLLYLLDPEYDFKIFEIIPKKFKISTLNSVCKFNIKLIKDVSPVIHEALKKDPKLRHYELKINDSFHVLTKIENLFQGKFVFFEESELPVVQKITDLLQITRCPNYMKINQGGNQNNQGQEYYLFNGVVMNPNYDFFLTNRIPKSFKIITNKKEYNCNIYGVYSSTIIRSLLKSQPSCKEFKYDFNDEFDEFQLICNFFNFQKIMITPDNMDVIKQISEDLKIDIIKKTVNNFIQKQESVSQTIDDCQNSVDLINDLFEWLYGIKGLTVETVKSQIIESVWSKTDDNIIELGAFILQVINHDTSLHDEIIELLTSLSDVLKNLTPFLVDKLMSSFGDSIENCSFVYKLYKKGIIQKDKLKDKLLNLIDDCEISVFINSMSWFLPEIIEFNILKENRIQGSNNSALKFVRSFLPDKIDLYKQMRDSEEPNDLITRTIRKDDVDTFQTMITQNHQIKKLSKCFIPYNIFDTFFEEKLTYLNYSAACGSIKCFKYLILNHEEVSQKTFSYAILSGNIEIIKIVDQQLAANSDNKKTISISTKKAKILPLIRTHKNDLFDWVFEQKFTKDDMSNDFINDLVICSVKNGNVHALIEFIDHGYDFISNLQKTEALRYAAKNGFCKLLNFLNSIIDKKTKNYASIAAKLNGYNDYVSFGNLSIYEIFLNAQPPSELIIDAISHAIIDNKVNIIDFFFNVQVKKRGFLVYQSNISSFLNSALAAESEDLFEYLIENFIIHCPKTFKIFEFNINLLETACSYKKVKAFHTIIGSVLKQVKYKSHDFTKCFFNAINSDSIEICKYLIDNKLFTNFDLFLLNSRILSRKNQEIISLIIGNCDDQLKERILESLLRPAIENHNLELVEFLMMKENIFYDDLLISAVNSNDSELVSLFLKYKNDPLFINQGSVNGTPLSLAVKHNNCKIVKILLSTPSINPNLYDRDMKTPLMRAIESQNYEIILEFLSFYKEKIFERRDQIDYFLNRIVYNSNNNNINDIEQYEQINKIFEYLMSFDQFKNIIDERNYKFLIDICAVEEFTNIIKSLLNFENIDFNIYSPSNGDTPLIVAIKNKNVGIAELLINDPRTNINMKNYSKQSPLTVAIQKELDTIIELLLNNKKLDSKESLLNYAFIISNVTISKILLSRKLVDVNCKFYGDDNQNNYYYNQEKKVSKTALLQAVKKNDSDKIDLIINHPEFDKEKSLLKDAISLAIMTKKTDCLKKLINILSIKEINEFKYENKSLPFLLIDNDNDEIFDELLQNPEFIISNEDIIECFYSLLNVNEKSFHFMSLLVDYDKKHNKSIDFDHYSFLTGIRSELMSSDVLLREYENILNLIDQNTKNKSFFNLCNSNWTYPFEHAIKIGSKDYALALINTKKINFTQRLYRDDTVHKYTTYFHIAASSINSTILQLLVDKKILNSRTVNIVDYDGNTPLMKACKHLRIDSVNILFQIEGLHYSATNHYCYDAMQIVRNLMNKDSDNMNKSAIGRVRSKLSKDEYLKQLIAAIHEVTGEFYDDDDENSDYNNVIINDDDNIEDDDDDDDDGNNDDDDDDDDDDNNNYRFFRAVPPKNSKVDSKNKGLLYSIISSHSKKAEKDNSKQSGSKAEQSKPNEPSNPESPKDPKPKYRYKNRWGTIIKKSNETNSKSTTPAAAASSSTSKSAPELKTTSKSTPASKTTSKPRHNLKIGWGALFSKINETDSKSTPPSSTTTSTTSTEKQACNNSTQKVDNSAKSATPCNWKEMKKESLLLDTSSENKTEKKSDNNEANANRFKFVLPSPPKSVSSLSPHEGKSEGKAFNFNLNDQTAEATEKEKGKPIVFKFSNKTAETTENRNCEEDEQNNEKQKAAAAEEEIIEFIGRNYDEDYDVDYYCPAEIDQNYAFQQQFYYLSQFSYLRQSLFDVQMNLNMEIMRKSHKKSKKNKNKK